MNSSTQCAAVDTLSVVLQVSKERRRKFVTLWANQYNRKDSGVETDVT